MSAKNEERGVSAALGQIPKVNNQRAFSCTVTIAGVGLGDITVGDIISAIISQHLLISSNNSTWDQLYVHKTRCYGTAGGYLSMAPYPHRFNYVPSVAGDVFGGRTWNSYKEALSEGTLYRKGSLCQQYEFGINGATRPELTWNWPEIEVINNPFIVSQQEIQNNSDGSGALFNNNCKMLTIQSTNVNGNALYIVQFDVTLRNSNFVEIAPALGAAAFGEKNVVSDNYVAPVEIELKKEEGKKAEELANKKRKVENVKALTLPALDAH